MNENVLRQKSKQNYADNIFTNALPPFGLSSLNTLVFQKMARTKQKVPKQNSPKQTARKSTFPTGYIPKNPVAARKMDTKRKDSAKKDVQKKNAVTTRTRKRLPISM